MDIVLHRSDQPSGLGARYTHAFTHAVELYLVSAYLTEWSSDFKLTPACKTFRFIVGKDFGLTRKEACRKVLKWLPAVRKADFLVAERIDGFHPKAAFWREKDGKNYMLVGSSNLSRAAFNGNVEANILARISERRFQAAKAWIEWIVERSVPVSEDWLSQYVEAQRAARPGRGKRPPGESEGPVITFALPRPPGAEKLLEERRAQIAAHARRRSGLERLFRRCAEGKTSNAAFYTELPRYWSWNQGNRLQGNGWERQGKHADFRGLSRSLLAILQASKGERDDIVRAEIDRLHQSGNTARQAFLSEMLCLSFPDLYPVVNKPVRAFLAESRLKAQRGASEGARYIDLARKLRLALRTDPDYPAQNLAELDRLVWATYGNR